MTWTSLILVGVVWVAIMASIVRAFYIVIGRDND